MMLGGGLALFLIGILGAVQRAHKVFAIERGIALVVIVAVLLGFGGLQGILLLLLVDLVLLAMIVIETIRFELPNEHD